MQFTQIYIQKVYVYEEKNKIQTGYMIKKLPISDTSKFPFYQ